ncbi:MAG TPA: Ig-like domain-containing protein [bacterium]|nr:Ig-like domain-containing protein [bacterium]
MRSALESSMFRGAAVGVALAVLLCQGCAKRGLPPGGPEDKTPPVVETMSPASAAVRVDPRSPIMLNFSEPMKRRTVETAVIVSPPTRWAKRYWKGNTYTLIPSQPLLASTTYLVSLGASAVDRHGVKLGKTFVAGFSTGESLEAGVISGKLSWKGLSVEQALVEAFDAAEIGEITGFPTADPDYVSLTGSGGQFEIPFVNPKKTYCVFAFVDANANSEYDRGETVGCAGGEFSFADSSRITGVDFSLCDTGLKGSLGGTVLEPEGLDTLKAGARIAVIARAVRDSVSYRAQADDKGRFVINCMNPAEYVVEAFLDYNGNQRKDVADTFYVRSADTLSIRPCAKPQYVEMRLKRED